jgi:hypothetical protein
MTAIRIEQFAGIAPRYSDRLLQPQNSTIAANVKLISGELRGLHEVKTVTDFSGLAYTVRRAFRLPYDINSPVPLNALDTWVPFRDEAVDFVRSPVQGDSFERYYWTGDSSSPTAYGGVPKYNTRARLISQSAPYRLGVPRPVAAPTVTPPTPSAAVPATGTLTAVTIADGDTVTIEATVYTFVNTLASAFDVLVGGTASDSLDNLIAAINGAAGEGSTYGTGTTANTDVTAVAGAGITMDVTAITAGVIGNSINTSETLTSGSWGSALLTGGVDAGTGTATNRVYVYTFVSAYGEEGQPSDPTLAQGDYGTWAITGMDAAVPNPSERNITHVNIYRTRPGISTTEYFYVGQVNIGTTSFNDAVEDDDVALNPLLESTTWAEPPAGLQGLTVHPGGFLVGFVGRDLYMSQPYRPHAWPVEYILSMQTEIKGLAIFNNSIIVATSSHPYIADGSSPIAMSLMKLDSIDPCVSKRSVATTLSGVFYASVQGIVQVTGGGNMLATRNLFTREEWYGRYNPEGVKAVPYGLQYIAFDTPQTGFIFSPAEQLAPLTELDRFNNVQSIQIDPYTGDVYIVRANRVALWDPIDTTPYEYQWRSKVFDLPRPVNFAAMQVKFKDVTVTVDEGNLQDYAVFNAARILKPLNTLNLHAINAVRVEDIPEWPYEQNKTPIGGSPLFRTETLGTIIPAVTVRVWARMQDSTMQEVFAYTLTDEGVYRLPHGFKSDVWQFEMVSNTDIYSFAIAETGKELVSV